MKDIFVIFDITGCVLHSLYAGKAPDQILLADGRTVNPPAHAVLTFYDRYLKPTLPFTNMGKVIAVNEDGENAYRKSLTDTYKLHRHKEKEGLSDREVQALKQEGEIRSEAKNAVLNMLIFLGVTVVELPHQEADDVIAFLAKSLPGKKFIYTVDGDLIALANETTFVYQKGEPKKFYETQDQRIPPRYVTLYKSLVGDPSDGYPGVKGFGPKKWDELVQLDKEGIFSFDELVTIAENFSNLHDKTLNMETEIVTARGRKEFAKLEELAKSHKVLALIISAAQFVNEVDEEGKPKFNKTSYGSEPVISWGAWASCYQLAKMCPELVNAKIGKDFNQLKWVKRVPSELKMREALDRVGMGYMVSKFEGYFPKQTLVTRQNLAQFPLSYLAELFRKSEYIALDWETWAEPNANFKEASKGSRGDYIDMVGSRITGAGITCGKNHEHTFYFQFEHADEENNIPKSFLLSLLGEIPDDMPVTIQNALFELTVLRSEFGLYIDPIYDTMVMHCHIDEMESSGLKDLSQRYLGYKQQRYEDVVLKGTTMKDYTGEHVFQYGADDPLVTAHLFDLFYIILNLEKTWEFVRDNEFPTIQLLAEANVKGVSLDWKAIDSQRKEDEITVDRSTAKMRDLLRANPGNVYSNAEYWYKEEFKPVWDFYARNLEGVLKKVLKDSGADKLTVEDLRQQDAFKLMGKDLLKGVLLQDSYTVAEAILAFSEAHTDYEQSVLATLRARFTYEDYVEVTRDEDFKFYVSSHLDTLAKAVGISLEKGKMKAEEYLAKLSPLCLSSSQKLFLDQVTPLLLEQNAAKRKKLPEFALVKARWDGLKIKKTESSGFEMNLNSTRQMQDLLYGMLGLNLRVRDFNVSDARKDKGLLGSPQANEEAIQEAIAWGDAEGWQAEVLENLLRAKQATTRIGLFYSKFPLWKHPKDGLIHPQFRSCGTESRRPTGGSPNMLQLPKKNEGKKVRKIILPNENLGHDLVGSCDWAGEELRIIAGLSKDKNLLSCYVGEDLKDVHSLVAAEIVGCSYEVFVGTRKRSFTQEQLGYVRENFSHQEDWDKLIAKKAEEYDNIRKAAKSVVFGGNYGIGAAKLSRQLHIQESEAKTFLAAKKEAYSGMETWKDEVKAELAAKGYVATTYGSRKHVFNRLNNHELAEYYKRSAVNYLVQGVAADYLKVVLATLWKRKTFQRHKALFYFGIYDELVWSCHSSQAVSLIKEIYEVMVMGIPGVPVEMLAMPAVGRNFADQVEILEDENQKLTDDLIQAAIDKALR